MNKQNKNILIDTENKLMFSRRRGVGEWVKKVKGLRNKNGHLQNCRGGVEYSLGNLVNNTVITMYSVGQVLGSPAGSLCKKCKVYSLCRAPETNRIQY